MRFTFSDTIAGYVTDFNRREKCIGIRTSDGRQFTAYLTNTTYARITHNLEEGWQDATGRLAELLVPGQYLYTYGIFYPQGDDYKYEVKSITFAGAGADTYRHEEPHWWLQQIRSIGDCYLRWQFGYPEKPVDYREYRTYLHLAGAKNATDFLQETDTISRLVYGFASAYLLTGEDRFLEGAERGTEYLRDHMRFVDPDEGVVYWYHGIQVQGNREQKLLMSAHGDPFSEDREAIPMYEQIYALAGPVQTYRATGDPRILHDAEQTVRLFKKFYRDEQGGGYFSHLDPLTLDPRSEALGVNRAKKNWNSVGDHAPAYLVNLYLATGEQEYAEMLEDTFDTIAKYFPDYERSPFVQERFYEDWSHDTTYVGQQNRAVVGHNLKISWNLMRMYGLKPKEEYVALARKIAELMPAAGSDRQRGGWYDVVERVLAPGEEYYRYVYHDRKAWWQQEQAILAYMILHGVLKDEEYLRHAREAAAFYNAWFLDHDDGAVYFNVMANGIPFLLGTERFKGSHSMSGYHSMELCYLAAVYTNLLITKQPMDFYFKPYPGGFKDNILRVSPDILPPGSVRLDSVEIDGEPYTNFDAHALTVKLPQTQNQVRVKARIVPNQ
ncbi:MAG: AGE family epimerase/isomerase [Anaerolineae bacterium]|nr:AGE family epimerase/isomerase [Anaerolineae bacterium]